MTGRFHHYLLTNESREKTHRGRAKGTSICLRDVLFFFFFRLAKVYVAPVKVTFFYAVQQTVKSAEEKNRKGKKDPFFFHLISHS